MTPTRLLSLTLMAAAVAACSSVPTRNVHLDQARSDYREAQANPQTRTLAPTELKRAGDALARAEASFSKGDAPAQVDQYAYLSRQRTALAREAADRKASEATVALAGAERDRLLLAARTREADNATMTAAVATRDAASAQRESDEARRQAAAAQQQAAASQQQAGAAERRSQALEDQLRDLDAKKTDRGMVITIGDVLFDTGRAELKAGGERNMDRLGGFLRQHPERKVLIEGYTDSTGGPSSNLTLSEQRADAVRTALLGMGVNHGQLATRGFGEAHPVAANDSASGRQMNRRVEIVLSDENGNLIPR